MSSPTEPTEQSALDSTSESTSDLISEVQDIESDSSAVTRVDELVAKLVPIYFVSGLGADERIFQWLRYEGYRPVHIQWVSPEPDEPIADYAKRLTAQIQDECPVVVGLSFGGLIAVEIAKQIETKRVILLSSAKDSSEIPFYFKLFRAFPIHRVFPFKSLLWAFYWLLYWLFGPEGADQKKLLKTVLVETDPHFLKWALHKVVTWKNREIPDDLVHIHGKGDRIFPYRFVNPNYSVENSGHLMVMNRAEEVSDLLEELVLRA
ncbi:alpha/beta hydrolase [cf. Phormidesmis sp. LEGE 11477]|uniref:alpha/beta hydrolase n=1 Tax=cf. Phormidesmis sp. LEGE 11477 TaxID=1828680 RepID=UPI00187F7F4D|nr:alpha/beta hydrolase [cf. Phormidesmis sp. LEGE 11477]MBE9060151.1 alpha/beta hydrolase [cf. Phormidesmis sp. LEGE 11477]